MHQKKNQKTQCERSPDHPKKDIELVLPVEDGSAKLSGKDYEFQEPTLRRVSTVTRESLSGESHGGRAKFRPEE